MPRFYFHLRAGGTIHSDRQGSECADNAAAHAHAFAVARQLLRNSNGATRLWSLCVEDEQGRAAFDLFLADVAAQLDIVPQEWQELAAQTCRRLTALTRALCAARETVLESRILLARARGKPQLVYARNFARRRT